MHSYYKDKQRIGMLLVGLLFSVLAACGGSSDSTVAADFSVKGVKASINGQNVTLDLSSLGNCAVDIKAMVVTINASGYTISPDPTVARDYSAPVDFTLVASDGSKVVYKVTITSAACVTPVVTLTGANKVFTNTLTYYGASIVNASTSAWSWLWGDGSVNSSSNPASKVWYKPGSYTISVTANTGSAAASAAQTVTVMGDPITAGNFYSCAIMANQTVSCWGYNYAGQLGDGSTTNRSTPTAVAGLSGVVALTARYIHTCALLSTGSVSCWGYNGFGQLGDGSTTNRLTPTAVAGLSGVVALTAGDDWTCALLSAGSVSCWGFNGVGQLGDGSTTDRSTPTAIAGLSGVVALTAGDAHTCALQSAGSVSCWGYNGYGQLGDGSTTTQSTPTAVTGGVLFWK